MQNATRSYIDCRDYPSEKNCSLRISGTDQEVLETAERHAVSAHGHTQGPELRENLRKALKAEN
ncbi:MAG: DUF1059 domain-containing protein [Candidatus Eremiobacteraeota bacterium]|nr:DUF1059 domain-containing protein [Candidatus Eremiobacteraeota bacterium]